jgi:hypothetical protein
MIAYRYTLAALFLVLAACSQAPSLEVKSDDELYSQAVLAGATGFVYYVAHNPMAADPYRVFRYDQATDTIVQVYSGVKEIQSVAGTVDGDNVYVSMRETSSSSSDFEIYKITSATTATKTTNNTVDDTNVSVSRNKSNNSIAWQSTNPNSNQYISVSFANGGGVSFIGGDHSVQPSISGNGRYVVYIEKTSGAQAVKIYDTQANTFTQVFTNGSAFFKPSFSDPSTCNDASKVVYLSSMFKGIGNISYSIRLYNRATNTITTIVSRADFRILI